MQARRQQDGRIPEAHNCRSPMSKPFLLCLFALLLAACAAPRPEQQPPPGGAQAPPEQPARPAPPHGKEAITGAQGNQIAVILPLQGRLRAPATAVRDGFLYAYYQQQGPRLPVRIYPGNGDGNGIAALYHQAVTDGARVIVGPLSKAAVNALALSADGNTPVLALNYPESHIHPPADFFEFGLSPAEEAAEVARRAASKGLKRALVLTPQGDRGKRILQAFRDALDAAGGSVVDYAVYDPGQDDYSQTITYLLQTGRKRPETQPANLAPSAVPYDPERRNDMDFIFFAAQPEQARRIRPQLRFYHASRVPTYAISSIYTGQPDPRHDSDMDGVRFCDMPWTLDQSGDIANLRKRAETLWPQLLQAQPRLFALGYDAYRLSTLIAANALSRESVPGTVTGTLSLSDQGAYRIRRHLVCAEFRNGKPQLLDEQASSAPVAARQ